MIIHMRTTLDIPEDLVAQATALLGFKSKTDTVVVALRELIRRHQLQELKSLKGKIALDIDLPRSRGRKKR
jgi:Arc/MetJ family transcription regulator